MTNWWCDHPPTIAFVFVQSVVALLYNVSTVWFEITTRHSHKLILAQNVELTKRVTGGWLLLTGGERGYQVCPAGPLQLDSCYWSETGWL